MSHINHIALIPAYEPSSKLINILKELKYNDFEIIVVDDGSGELYEKIFNSARKYATVISYKENKGKGHALKEGLTYIKDNFKDATIVTLDCDGQHTIKDTFNVCKEAEKNPNTLVLGKRLRDKKIPLRSKLGNSITRFIYKIKTGIDIYDTQTGLRAFSAHLIPLLLTIPGERFEYEMNVLLRLPKENVDIKEVTIETIYENNNNGSHFKTFRDSYLIYRDILGVRKYEK